MRSPRIHSMRAHFASQNGTFNICGSKAGAHLRTRVCHLRRIIFAQYVPDTSNKICKISIPIPFHILGLLQGSRHVKGKSPKPSRVEIQYLQDFNSRQYPPLSSFILKIILYNTTKTSILYIVKIVIHYLILKTTQSTS